MAFARDRAVHEVRNIGNGLERDFRAVESASASSTTGLQRLGAAFLAFLLGLALIDAATRFVEDILDFIVQRHSHLPGLRPERLTAMAHTGPPLSLSG